MIDLSGGVVAGNSAVTGGSSVPEFPAGNSPTTQPAANPVPSQSEDAASRSRPTQSAVEKALLQKAEFVGDRTPLQTAMRQLSEKHGINIELDVASMKSAGITRNVSITMEVRGVRLRSLMALILHDLGLTYEVQDDRVVIKAKEQNAATDSSNSAVMRQELLQMLLRGGKIESRQVDAAVTLVAAAGARDSRFAQRLLAEFDKSCRAGDQASHAKASLLAVMAEMFDDWSGPRWRQQIARSGVGGPAQDKAATEDSPSEFEIPCLRQVIHHGYSADRHDIDAFTLAVRQLHHPDGKQFLLDVLNNPFDDTNGKWADNVGGGWWDAKFVAAVGLAELGDSVGVEWLLKHAKPNDFGTDESLWRRGHVLDRSGSLRKSSHQALIDLFAMDAVSYIQVTDWWNANSTRFHATSNPAIARPVALKVD